MNQVISKRMVKKQQMRWSQRGAHLLLQIRTRVLNGEWEATFRTWYPGFRVHTPTCGGLSRAAVWPRAIRQYDRRGPRLQEPGAPVFVSPPWPESDRTAIMATIMKLRQCQPHDWHITTSWPTRRPGGGAGGTHGVIGDNDLLPDVGCQAGRGRRRMLACAPAPPPGPAPACRSSVRWPRPHDHARSR